MEDDNMTEQRSKMNWNDPQMVKYIVVALVAFVVLWYVWKKWYEQSGNYRCFKGITLSRLTGGGMNKVSEYYSI